MRRVRFQPCVYVVSARDFRVKVGISALLPRRLAQLIASEGEPLSVVHYVNVPTMRVARCIEDATKAALADHKIEGEWFSVTRSAAAAAVTESARLAAPPDDEVAGVRLKQVASENVAVMKAARRMLDWTIDELARKSGVSAATIRNIERGVTDPRIGTLNTLRAAFSAAGLVFLEPGDMRTGGKGVRLKD